MSDRGCDWCACGAHPPLRVSPDTTTVSFDFQAVTNGSLVSNGKGVDSPQRACSTPAASASNWYLSMIVERGERRAGRMSSIETTAPCSSRSTSVPGSICSVRATGRPHRLEVIFQDEDGDRLAQITSTTEPVWDENLPAGWRVGVLFGINMGIPLPRFGLYAFEILVNDNLVGLLLRVSFARNAFWPVGTSAV